MGVKNNFPDVDDVILRLHDFVVFFENKRGNGLDEEYVEHVLEVVDEFIKGIENYLDSVCNDQKRIDECRKKSNSLEDEKDLVSKLDDSRTMYHSEIIRLMAVIDRIAERNGIKKVFECLGQYEKDTGPLLAHDWSGKQNMGIDAKEKRRELGNFALYLAAGVTVGLEMTDRELRAFASCDTENRGKNQGDEARAAFQKVQAGYRNGSVVKNMNDMIK